MPNKLYNPDTGGAIWKYPEYLYKAEIICARFGFRKESATVLQVAEKLFQMYKTSKRGSWQDRNIKMADAIVKLLNVNAAHANFFISVLGEPYERKENE